MTAPRIALVTIFLPRMEMDHLAEWIAYHKNIGINHFYIYNNGHIAHDTIFKKGPAGKVWQKKPEANYHLDLSDEEVDERIDAIIQEAGHRVSHIAWPGGPQGRGNYRTAQMAAVNEQLRELQQTQEVDWLAYIDIDELIVPVNESLSGFLSRLGDDVAAVKISQKLFESRWQNGNSVPYAELTKAYGVLDFNRKLIARVSHARRWLNSHQMNVLQGRILHVAPDRLRFHHFRGNEHHGPPAPAGFGVNKYVKYKEPMEHDGCHVVIARSDGLEFSGN